MPSSTKSLRSRTRSSALAAALLMGGMVGVAPVWAQGVVGAGQFAPKRVQSAADVTFDLLSRADFEATYVATRTRRFLDPQGSNPLGGGGAMVQIRERLLLQGDGSEGSPFRLEFLEVVGSAQDPAQTARWGEVYRANAGLLHLHGGFRVRDAAAAARNYQVYDFGVFHRIGREVRRSVVFPRRMDKGIWLVDVDTETGVVLYSAEFDSSLRMLSEIETTTLSLGPIPDKQPLMGASRVGARPSWSWQPRLVVSKFPSFATAAAGIQGSVLVDPAVGQVVSEYGQHLFQVTEDPANGDRTLVLGFTDGIDEFFVLQTNAMSDPFKGNPSVFSKRDKTGSQTHAIASYDDPAMRVYAFYENGLLFQVVGRGSLVRLKGVATRVCQQAVTGR